MYNLKTNTKERFIQDFPENKALYKVKHNSDEMLSWENEYSWENVCFLTKIVLDFLEILKWKL